MTKILKTLSIFTESHEISIGDSILEEGVTLDIQNMEYPENKLRLDMTWEEFDGFRELVNNVEKPIDVDELIKEMRKQPMVWIDSTNTKPRINII